MTVARRDWHARLLVDSGINRAFRVLQEVDAETQERYRGFGIDLEGSSGRDHHTIAIPSIFVIDAEGKVRFAHADRDYRTRPTTAQVLAIMRSAWITGR